MTKDSGREQMGNIFAFDVLIMNVNRQVGKPNVLVKNQNIYVIDHELSMNIEHSFEDYLKQNRWDYSIKQNRDGHLFRQPLIIMKKRGLNFGEVSEYLRNLRPETLYGYAEQLAKYDDSLLRKYDRIKFICQANNADNYINPIGGQDLYDKKVFAEHGIKLSFVQTEQFAYPQFAPEFIPNLSIIDVLMHNGKAGTKQLLNAYKLI